MPKLLEKTKDAIMSKQGITEDKAYAIATASLQKAGYLKEGTSELTVKGKLKQKQIK